MNACIVCMYVCVYVRMYWAIRVKLLFTFAMLQLLSTDCEGLWFKFPKFSLYSHFLT